MKEECKGGGGQKRVSDEGRKGLTEDRASDPSSPTPGPTTTTPRPFTCAAVPPSGPGAPAGRVGPGSSVGLRSPATPVLSPPHPPSKDVRCGCGRRAHRQQHCAVPRAREGPADIQYKICSPTPQWHCAGWPAGTHLPPPPHPETRPPRLGFVPHQYLPSRSQQCRWGHGRHRSHWLTFLALWL